MLSILDFLFPKRCLTCWRFGKYFCDQCAQSIRAIGMSETICPVCERSAIGGMTHPKCQSKYSLDGLTSFFRYNGVVRKAIKAIKYRAVFDLAKEFVALIPDDSLSQIIMACHPCDRNLVLIPLPLHSSRFRERGFNQAEVLGNVLAQQLNIPAKTDILRRVKKTVPQVEMKSKDARLKNMDGVFAFHNSKCIIRNSHIVLLDDVFTTGATMRAAANVLKRAGAPFVWGITMAR